MALELTALDPAEIVVMVVAVGGLLPVALYARRLSPWLAPAYACLLVGAVATNAEHLAFPALLNGLEHVVGNLGAALAVAAYAYVHRGRLGDATGAVPGGE